MQLETNLRVAGCTVYPFALERLKQNGFSPEAVLDVGAIKATSHLCFDLWPESAVVFQYCRNRRIGSEAGTETKESPTYPCLLGADIKQRVAFNLAETASSVLEEAMHPNANKSYFPMDRR
jgi:hypothetical protein